MIKTLFVTALAVSTSAAAPWTSYYTVRLDDARAVYLTPENFPVHGDGIADDSDAMQQAINKVQDTTNQGILFIPAGRYRLTKTIYIWPGIRRDRVWRGAAGLVLGGEHAGLSAGSRPTCSFFAGCRPGTSAVRAPPARAQMPLLRTRIPARFIRPSATLISKFRTAIRARWECARTTPSIASWPTWISTSAPGLAGIHDGGNVAQDVHFYGGQYGIWTRKPSPGWQFTVIDATLRRPERSRDPRARSRPDAHPPAIQECSHRDFHRRRVFR